jgi:hypothetical protein
MLPGKPEHIQQSVFWYLFPLRKNRHENSLCIQLFFRLAPAIFFECAEREFAGEESEP